MPTDKITGTGVDGTTDPILQENDPLWALLIDGGNEPIDRPDQDRSGEEYGTPTTVTLHDDGPDFSDFEDPLEALLINVDGPTEAIEAAEAGAPYEEAMALVLDDLSDTQKPTGEPAESSQEGPLLDTEPVGEIDLDAGEQVFGISFPASMLPLSFNYGYWESEPILDPNGDPDAALVRVWLYPPEESSREANTPQETEGAS